MKVDRHAERIIEGSYDRSLFPRNEGRLVRTIQENRTMFTFLENIPVWRFFHHSEPFYFREDIVKEANKRGLKGFKETSKGIEREISHVQCQCDA